VASRKKDINPEVRQDILQGRGIEAIVAGGWSNFRNTLSHMSYAEIAQYQLAQAALLENSASAGAQSNLPDWLVDAKRNETEVANKRAGARAHQLAQTMSSQYAQNIGLPYHAYQEGDKKLWLKGKNTAEGATADSTFTRVYIALPTAQTPEAFQSLVESCRANGVLSDIDLALNFETYHDPSKSIETNAIIAYVVGEKPEVMDKLARSIQDAKRDDPTAWKLTDAQKAAIKRDTTHDLMVPLDDTTSFVEMRGSNSYHTRDYGKMYEGITGAAPFIDRTPESLIKGLEGFTPDAPRNVTGFSDRQGHMPALVTKTQ